MFCSMESKLEFEISRIRAATRSQQLYCTVFENDLKQFLILWNMIFDLDLFLSLAPRWI